MSSLLEEKLGITISDTLCISLINETERREKCISECKKLNLSVKFYLPEPNKQSGVQGCLESHLYCIKYAKEHNLENVLIIEDDITFDIDAINNIDTIDIPKDFDMLYLGYHVNRGYRFNNNLLKLTSALTTHAYIINKKMYDIILDNIANDWFTIPEFSDLNIYEKPFFANNLRAIDIFYAKWIHHQGGNSYGIYPMIAYQRSEFSSIENKIVDYTNLFKTKANMIAGNYKGKLIGEWTYSTKEEKDEIFTQLQRLDCNKEDYVLFKHSKNNESINYDIDIGLFTILSSDLICLSGSMKPESNPVFYVRFNYFTKNISDINIQYVYPVKSVLKLTEYHENVLMSKQIICFYYQDYTNFEKFLNITGLTKKYLDNYNIHICTDNTDLKSNKDITIISKQEYQYLPKHSLVLFDDITFFIDQPTNCFQIILFMTSDKFIPTWKDLPVPVDGYALFHNMLFCINKIVCCNKNVFNNFISTYGIMSNSKTTFILSNSLNKKIHNSFICNASNQNNIDFFNRILLEIPNAKLTTFTDTDEIIDFSKYEILLSFDSINENILKGALSQGIICIGNHKYCSINTLDNSLTHIISFIRNPIKKLDAMYSIYSQNYEYYIMMQNLFDFI
jgi:glycosyl transferase family 25